MKFVVVTVTLSFITVILPVIAQVVKCQGRRDESPLCVKPVAIKRADFLTVSVHPRVQPHAFTSVCTLKIP